MKTFRNKNFTKRDYECTNIVACVAWEAPGENWTSCDDGILKGLTKLYREGDVSYYGYM